MLFLGKKFAGATFKKGENIDQFLLDYCNKTLIEITTPADCDIRNYFFRDQNQLQSVTFGEGCTTLNYGACMYCSSLRNVYIPNSVTYIENDAFEGCSNIHFVIDNSSSNLRGYPWSASDCSVEWLRGDDGPSLDSNFIFYNDYNTMEQSSQQGNTFHGFVFNPSMTPCVNPESLEMLYQGRLVVGIEVMTNPYSRQEQPQPIFVNVWNREPLQKMTGSVNMGEYMLRDDFDNFVRFDFEHPIMLDPNSRYQLEFTRMQQGGITEISPATFTMEPMDQTCGCYYQHNGNVDPSTMVAFKLIFE